MTTTTTATERRRLTAIRAAWLFDGTGSALTENPTVVLDGTTIVSVGASAPTPEGATVIELAGATLLPGLVDGHVHTVFDSSDDVVGNLAARDDAAVFAAMAAFARTAARGGITTMRDLGDRGYLSLGLRSAAQVDLTMPEVLVSGPPITTPGGHCHFLGEGAAGVAGVRAAIAERAERGVDVIKIMASGGNMTPGSRADLPQYGPAELKAAVDEAHRHGLQITAHAHGTQSIIDVLEAGLDGIEHMSFMTEDGVDEVPAEVLASVGRGTITVGLTLGFQPVEGAGPPPGMIARMPALMANARRIAESGARVIVGSDAGIAPIKPPDAARWSIAQLMVLGLTPAQALHAITARAATACGVGDRKGRLAPGYDADVLAVDGNVLTDPTALQRIRAVYVRGSALV